MTDTVHHSSVEACAEEEDPQRLARKAARYTNLCVQVVTSFVNEYSPAKADRDFTHLPVDKEQVLDVADKFQIVASFIVDHESYYQKTGIHPEKFEQLHAAIEQNAQNINPLRSMHIVT